MKSNIFKYISAVVYSGCIMLISCHPGAVVPTAADTGQEPVSPVKVINPQYALIRDSIELTAVSAYLQKSFIKSNINGYVQFANAVAGQKVNTGSLLFSLITKEAKAIGNEVNRLDPSFRFSGVSHLRAGQPGFITVVNHQNGDYVQDGEAMATISNLNSLVFLMELPYELHTVSQANPFVELTLPDGEQLIATCSGTLPLVDSVSQTQRIILKVKAKNVIPEGLVARVKLIRHQNAHAILLPKSAVLSNDTEDEFWVMKMISDTVAVRVKINKGMANTQFIEITDPVFKNTDRIISSGNYGIADTAKVRIIR